MDIEKHAQMMRWLTRPRSQVPGPRNMADGGRIGFNGGNIVKAKEAAKKYGVPFKTWQTLTDTQKSLYRKRAQVAKLKAENIKAHGERVSKLIREFPNGQFRFETESGGGFSKTFSKGTTLKEVEKFRDKHMEDLDKKGLLRKSNPSRNKYVGVKDQKHIKFNGVNYQVNIQRGDEGAQYFSSLKDAIKERDTLVKKYPPKSLAEYNIKEKTKKVNEDILKLSKNSTIKNMFKTGVLDEKAIAQAAEILGVNKGTAIDRLEQLSTALMGTRKDVPGIKPAFTENARKIAASLPGAKTKAAELATGVPLEGESISVPKKEIGRDAKYPTDWFDIDEARATASGLKRNTSPWSIFGQVIDKNVNRIAKGGFEGGGWDSRAGTLEKELDDAVKNFGPDSKEAKAAMTKYNKEATKFENEVNRKKLRGAKRVRIPRISLDAPSQTIANWGNFNKKYKDIFNENFKTKRYGFVIPKDLKTIPELRKEVLNPKSSTYKTMINHLKEGFNEYDEKKLFQKINQMTPDAVKKILRRIPRIAQIDDFETNRFASADNIMTSGVKYVDDVTVGGGGGGEEGNFITRNPYTTAGAGVAATAATKPGRKFLGKAFNLGTGPMGAAGLTYAFRPEGGYDLRRPEDRITFEAEAALAPTLVKGAQSVTEKIKNPLLRKGLEYASGIRLPGVNPANMLRAARVASPFGLLSLAGEGIYHAGKKEMERRAKLSPQELADFHLKRQSRGWSGMANGGIMSLKKKW